MEDPFFRLRRMNEIIRRTFDWGKTEKKNQIIILLILMFGIRIFFSAPFEQKDAQAHLISAQTFLAKAEIIDPLEKTENGILGKNCSAESLSQLCRENKTPKGEGEAEREKSELEKKIEEMTEGFPISQMTLPISELSQEAAYYMIAIAKKESNWGKHSPEKNGRDCFNYWGFKGGYNPTSGGYSCFETPEQAVDAVGGRIEELLNQGVKTPSQFLVWKCGSTCAGHDPKDVSKWVTDVGSVLNSIKS